MNAALGWLGELVEWLVQFCPRIYWVPPTHKAITFTRGKIVKVYGPGLVGVWYRPMVWPAWTVVTMYPVVRQTHNMPSQTLTTCDKISVTVAGVIVYRISDLKKALTEQWDLEETIGDISITAMRRFVSARNFDQLRVEDGSALCKAIQKPLQRYGVDVSEAWITDLAITKVLTVIGHPIAIEEE